MVRKVWQTIILILIMTGLALVQNSFIGALASPFRQFNLLLSSLIFILFFLDFRLALLSVFIAGFFLDLISFNFFGFYLLIFFLTIIAAQWVLKNWLTNRSFYTLLALMILAAIFYNLLAALALYLAGSGGSLFLWRMRFWLTLAYQSFWSGVFALVMFNIAAALSKRIKPFFLEGKSLYDEF